MSWRSFPKTMVVVMFMSEEMREKKRFFLLNVLGPAETN